MRKKADTVTLKQEQKKQWWLLFTLLTGTVLIYSGIFNLDFTNWDDTLNVTENTAIRSFSLPTVKTIFTTSFIGMYVPLTMLSYAMEYFIFGLNPVTFHATNLLLHLINTALVYLLIKKTIHPDKKITFILTGLFALHPLQVESVAWVSGRSTLLYVCFLLAALIVYINYISTAKKQYFYVTLLFFLLSLLSKSSAIILPILLLAVDYLLVKKITRKTFIEKIPFFALALLFGIITLAIRTPEAATANSINQFNFLERIVLACYALLFYILKFIIPVNLCIYYPYPEKIKGLLPWFYYITPIIIAAMGWWWVRLAKKIPIVIWGSSLVIAPLLLVIQLIPFESVNFVADRYAYLPVTGLVILLIAFIRKFPANTTVFTTIYLVFIIVMTFLTYQRVAVWKNSITLFTDMIVKNPTNPYAYHSRGHEYLQQKKFNEALNDFNQSLKLKPDYFEANYNRGLTKYSLGDATRAIIDFDKALSIEPSYSSIYYSRGLAQSMLLKHTEAIADYTQAESLGFKTVDLYINRGNARYNLVDFSGSLTDYYKALALQPDYVLAWDHIGPANYQLKNYKAAEEAYTKAIELHTTYTNAYRDRGIIRGLLNNFSGAVDDFTKMIETNPNDGLAYYNRGLAYQKLQQMENACADWRKAASLGSAEGRGMLENYCR